MYIDENMFLLCTVNVWATAENSILSNKVEHTCEGKA